MKSHSTIWCLVLALLVLSLSACSTPEVGVERTATPGTALVATQAPSPPPATAAPPAPTAHPSATPTSAGVERVKVFLVALDDGGVAGEPIGCGDSIVAVERQIAPTQEPLRAAFDELLSMHEYDYGESGLYNALYQCDLQVEQVSLAGGKATIQLAGTFMLGGTCDIPRVEAQLTETALQFPTVQEVDVFVNGRPLSEFLSLK